MLRLVWLAIAALPAALAAQAPGGVRGRVLTDSTGQPIADAQISLGNAIYTAQSDSLGRYRISGIRAGRYSVLVRRLGFEPLTTTVTVAAGDSLDADFLLVPLVQALSEVEITATLIERKLRDFNDRRRFGIGRFLNEEEIRKAPGSRLSEKVRAFPGLVVVYSSNSSNDVRVASSRGQQSIMARGPCFSAIMLDGLLLVQPFSINSLDPGEVAAIEWYSGPSQMPAQFNSTRAACGLLVIWTK